MLHALVVGGTGMLKGVCQYLVDQGYRVSVIARHAESLDKLAVSVGKHQEFIDKIALDWNDSASLEHSIKKSIEMFGPIALTVAWIHSTAPDAPTVVARLTEGDFFHVRPTSVIKPGHDYPGDTQGLLALPNISYHVVLLGSWRENGKVRWLTDEEISNGVIEAIKSNASRFIVGKE